jgi:branched-chain amino acid transport system substrate-binding protein
MSNRKCAVSVIVLILAVALIILPACAQSAPSPAPAKSSAPAPATPAAPVSAGAPTSTSAASGAPIKIGVIMSLTGLDAMNSPGIKAALDYRPAQYGGQVAGRKIQIIIEDDASDPVTGMDKVKKLMQSDNVDVIMGGTNGAVAASVVNYMKQFPTPVLLHQPKSPTILNMAASNIFLPFGTNAASSYYAGFYASQKAGHQSAVLTYEDFIGGQELISGAKTGFEKGGGKVVQQMAIKSGTADFSPYISTINQADCVIFWFTPLLTQRFLAQYFAAGIKMPLTICNTSVLFPKTLEDIGEKTIGITGVDNYTSVIDNPLNKTFVADISQKYGFQALTTMAVSADVNLLLYLEAVKATGGDTSPAKINEALHSVKVDTEAGTFSLTANGLGKADLYILKVIKGPAGFSWQVIDKFSQVVLDAPK